MKLNTHMHKIVALIASVAILSVLRVIRLSTTIIVAKEQQVLDSPSDINDSHSSSRVSTGTSASALLNDQTLDFRFGSKR